MKLLKNNKILLLLIIAIAFWCINSGKALGVELNFGGADGVVHAWQLQPSGQGTWFCVDSSKALRFVDDFGKKSVGVTYQPTGETIEFTPRLAYALYYIKQDGGIKGNASKVQDLVWAAAGDPRGRVNVGGDIGARVNTYFSAYDEIFSKVNGELFKSSTNEEDLKVLVDQIGGTYTVGPYNLELTVNASKPAKSVLYNEIIGKGNQGYTSKNKFAKWSGKVNGINGTEIKLVDKNGKEIDFPDFVNNEPFYIRFKPNNGGAIKEIGQPRISVEYIKEIKVASSSIGGSAKSIFLRVFKCTDIITDYAKVDLDAEDSRFQYLGIEKIISHTGGGRHDKTQRWEGYISARADVLVHFGKGIDAPYSFENLSLYFTFTEEGTPRNEWVSTGVDEEGNEKGYWDTVYDFDYEYPPNPPHKANQLKEWYVQNTVVVHEHEYKSLSDNIQPIVNVPENIPIEIEFGFDTSEETVGKEVKRTTVTFPTKKINEQIGGHVFLDKPENKTGKIDGIRKTGTDSNYAGVQVQLWELDNANDTTGTLVATTTTDKNGRYKFYGLVNGVPLINPLKKYYVTFTYNGQMYQSTYYKNALTGGFSNAKDVDRESFNTKFKSIYSDTQNYSISSNWRKSYALLEKVKNKNGDYISWQGNDGDAALTYSDVWDKFIEFATNTTTYTSPEYKDASKTWVKGTSKTNATTWQKTNYGNVTTWHNYTYDDAFKKLNNWLVNTIKIGQDEANKLVLFIKDSMITATTQQTVSNKKVVYPVYDKFVLENIDEGSSDYKKNSIPSIKMYANQTDARNNRKSTYSYLYTKHSDQSRYVDYGVTARVVNDLALQKDVYKTTVIVNGKKEEYIYNKKDLNADGGWDIKVRASDALYNGAGRYDREVRKSEYLYNGTDGYANGNNAKNMQVYVTYRIAVKNQGNVRTKIDEIVDYYDDSAYEFDGTLSGNQYSIKSYKYSPTENKKYGQNGDTYVNSYVGSNATGNILSGASLTVKTIGIDNRAQETISGSNYNLKGLYLTGIKSSDGKEYLEPGKLAYVYITFKAKNDINTNKVKLDQDLLSGNVTVGKRNIAEINAYSTQYTENAVIPNYLKTVTKDGKTSYETIDQKVGGKDAGLIDTDSNPGSLTSKDLNNNGDIITNKNDSTKDRQQDDTDKAPNIRLIIDTNANDTRVMSGYVFEDNRTVNSNSAVVGNGLYDNNEIKINGVTLELVELVQNVDENGIFNGTYSGEKVWETYNYTVDSNNKITLNGGAPSNVDYYSGYGSVSGQPSYQTILTGNGILAASVPDDLINLRENNANGQYAFVSVPAGDFYIRFTYGEHDRTVLKASSNEVNNELKTKGLNEKSYNGQDFKSTVYQANLSQDTGYNGINGFKNYDVQNYSNETAVNNGTEKASMYFYDISVGDTNGNVSDAKDLLYYRKKANEYAQEQQNYKAEVLNSFEKLGQTYNNEKLDQRKLVEELKNNTYQVAQTGIIRTEVEYNKQQTKNDDNHNYTISNINLGLVERPRAQLELKKEVSNVRLTLANGTTQFDTNKSVNNLYYAQHKGHSEEYIDILRINKAIVNKDNIAKKPELIQVYIDDELMEGSTLNVEYKITAKNVGEVDYLDNQFYYTGRTSNTAESNISKTNVKDIVDYVSNEIKYEQTLQNRDAKWNIKSPNELVGLTSDSNQETPTFNDTEINNALVNRKYYDKLKTYNMILTTDKLQKELLPTTISNEESKTTNTTTLVLSTAVSANVSGGNNLVYNNLAEIAHFTNSQGRRMQFSIVGNQPMADQNAGNGATESNADLITPTEIDADSAQKILLMPPTGANKNYIPVIGALVVAAGLIIAGVVLVKRNVVKK